LEQASVYTQESNQDRQQALQASGAKSEVARVLTGITSGTDQYFQILEVGRQLLEYGKQAEQQGDLYTARQFYESARTFGAQVADSSNLSSEQLGGLDVQSAALDSLSQLSEQVGSGMNPDTLTEQVNALVQAYNTIVILFEGLSAFFSGNISEDLLRLIANFILQNGDIDLVEYFAHSSGA
jgi:hypothetical protein